MAFLWTAFTVGINIVNAAMSDFDPDISNGTCYYKEGEQADDAYAPAGNAAIGHVFCCQVGDKLNQNNSCAAVLEGGGKCTVCVVVEQVLTVLLKSCTHTWLAAPIPLTDTTAVRTKATTPITNGWAWYSARDKICGLDVRMISRRRPEYRKNRPAATATWMHNTVRMRRSSRHPKV